MEVPNNGTSKDGGRVSPTNLITFAGTQNGE
jgi:hypothetical protein